MSLNIKAVSERTGVPLHTLRAWERRYGIPRPERNAENRYRLYDEQDIADVLWMKRQVEQGVSPAQASALLREHARGAPEIQLAPATLLTSRADALYDAFFARDEAAAQKILNEAWSILSPEQMITEILEPTLRRIGDNWQRNLLSVEQEHFASNLVRQRLHALLQAQPAPLWSASRLVAACAPEEQHDLGLLMFTLLARRHGWNVTYLGQRTPLTELRHIPPDVQFILLSVSTVTGLASLLPLWSEPLPPAPLLFGGEVFRMLPALREHLPGAYLGKDGVTAIQQLVTRAPRLAEWKPARRMLNAARALDAVRLQLASDAANKYVAALPKLKNSQRDEFRHDMTHAALFLTDACICAFAFGVPELMDLQGVWANVFMPAHRVAMSSFHQFLDVYRAASARHLNADTAAQVSELVERLGAATDPAQALKEDAP